MNTKKTIEILEERLRNYMDEISLVGEDLDSKINNEYFNDYNKRIILFAVYDLVYMNYGRAKYLMNELELYKEMYYGPEHLAAIKAEIDVLLREKDHITSIIKNLTNNLTQLEKENQEKVNND